MKISIIGAGNMGSAIARGIMSSKPEGITVCVSNPIEEQLQALSTDYAEILTTTDNKEAIKDANVVIFAVKPWILPEVAAELRESTLPPIVVSIAAGIGLERLHELFGSESSVFYVIPNTAIMVGHGMTFITTDNGSSESTAVVQDIFDRMGTTAVIPEKLIGAATALSSCGIAYAFKYIQACVQAGIQLGFRPDEAQKYAVATVCGAMEILRQPGTAPQTEIDRVTTPGGMTIRGINMLEHTGFTSSVINSIIEPLKK